MGKKNKINLYTFLGIAGMFFFLLIVVILHFVNRTSSPVIHYISEYAILEQGWLLNVALCGNFVSLSSLSIVLYIAYEPPLRSWLCIISTVITAFTTTIIANIFPTDLHGNAITPSGYIHNFSALTGTLAFLLSMNIFSFRLKRHSLLTGKYVLLIFLAIASSAIFVVMLFLNDSIQGYAGLIQRIFSLAMIGWVVLFLYGVRSGTITLLKQYV
ncbi:MAG: DUF998 domain-containing protein [Cytophagales bacterium]|nr:DUF998 domain-containing protein [Cytophagales bacterium]